MLISETETIQLTLDGADAVVFLSAAGLVIFAILSKNTCESDPSKLIFFIFVYN